MPALLRTVSAAAVVVLLSGPLSATPKDTPLPGSTVGATAHHLSGFCAVKAGASAFEKTSGGVEQVLVEEIYYDSGVEAYLLSGLARFKFTGNKKGRLLFDTASGHPVAVMKPRFSNYRARFKKKQDRLKLSFDIAFPDCTVRFSGKYWD